MAVRLPMSPTFLPLLPDVVTAAGPAPESSLLPSVASSSSLSSSSGLVVLPLEPGAPAGTGASSPFLILSAPVHTPPRSVVSMTTRSRTDSVASASTMASLPAPVQALVPAVALVSMVPLPLPNFLALVPEQSVPDRAAGRGRVRAEADPSSSPFLELSPTLHPVARALR